MAILLTPDVLRDIAEIALDNRIKTCHIEQKKSGKKKGKVFAEYTVWDGDLPENAAMTFQVSEILEKLADDMEQGARFLNVQITKPSPDVGWAVIIERLG